VLVIRRQLPDNDGSLLIFPLALLVTPITERDWLLSYW
jgi:hypothetical protein